MAFDEEEMAFKFDDTDLRVDGDPAGVCGASSPEFTANQNRALGRKH